MKKLSLSLLACVGLMTITQGYSQTNAPVLPPSNNGSLDWNAKDWVFIPYGAYDLTQKKWGYGGALLYAVSTNFWTGIRAQNVGNLETEAGVQAQLQITRTYFGITVTPFIETSVGLGRSALYGNAGAGALVKLHTWTFSNGKFLDVGAIGDYERYVQGTQSGNQANLGMLFRYSF